MIEITDHCNLKCVMCASNKCIGHMDYSKLLDLLKQISRFSKERKIIQITGGEPLLHPQFRELSFYVKGDSNIYHLSSNGMHVDRFIEEVLNYDLLNISIDGFREANDLVRQDGVFDKVIDNLRILLSAVLKKGIRFEVCFNILITKHNYRNLYSLVKYLHGVYPYSKFQLLNIVKNNSQVELGLDDDLGAVDNPLILADEIMKIQSYCRDNNCVFFYPEDYLKYLSTKRYSRWECYAGYNRAGISANGDVWICDTSLGNTKKDNLKKIWYSREARAFRKKIKQCRAYCFQDCYKYKNI